MRKMIIECDKCHKVISGNPIAFSFKRTDRETGDFIADDSVDDQTFELCDDCADKLGTYITGSAVTTEPDHEIKAEDAEAKIENALEPKQEGSKSPKKPGQKAAPIDHAKIKALHTAGWKPKDIAGDMGLDVRQIYNSLSYHK